MQSCKVALEIQGEKMELIEYSAEFSRSTDKKGCPCGPIHDGRFSFSLYGTSSTRLAELMLNLSNKPFSGRILIYKAEGRLREILFTEGYIVHYKEHYTQKREGVLFINCAISARVIEIGDAYYNSMW